MHQVLPSATTSTACEATLCARGVSKRFGRVQALDDFSVAMHRGRSFSLIGPNGSGKTTFIKCLLGLVLPDSGDITLDGRSLLKNPALRSHVGYMPQIGRFPDNMRIGEVFDLMKELRRDSAPQHDEDLVEAYEIGTIAHKRMHTLSGGTRQKVSACLAFLFRPDVLVLDEPTAGLDPVAADILKEKVLAEKHRGRLILLTSHILSDVDEIATDIVFLMDGRVQFSRSIDELRRAVGEEKLARIVTQLMRSPEMLAGQKGELP